MTYLTSDQEQHLRAQLIREKDALEHQLGANDRFGLTDSLIQGTGELSTYDNHPADLGSEVFERSKDLALTENSRRHLADVLHALADMDLGKYGICKACGRPISYERLEAIPTAAYCLAHEPRKHVSQDRPVEEELLAPPFGRTSFDERQDETEFDGEDAWQIVESWGSSNTPAMAESPQIESYEEMAIEADENTGYVEALESFLATDIYGKHVSVIRNDQYRKYMHSQEGEPLLEQDEQESGDSPL